MLSIQNLYSPFWALAAAIVALATVRYLRLDRLIPDPEFSGSNRAGELDGLRGVLAFSVFLTHAASSYRYWDTGEWRWPPSHFYTMLGFVPVSLFFMITGFLFWTRVLSSGINWRIFFVRRAFRLLPLYLFSLVLLLVIVAILSRGRTSEPLLQILVEVSRWASLGVFGRPDINGVDRTWIINTATWTLRPEAIFYAALPILVAFRRSWTFALLAIGIVIAAALQRSASGGGFWINFLFGMIAAYTKRHAPEISQLRSRWMAILSVSAIGIPCIYGFYGYGLAYALYCFPLFLCALYGNSFLGLLSLKETRWLGEISYSVYLLHCPLLYATFYTVKTFRSQHTIDPSIHLAACGMVTVALVIMSSLTYVNIEKPFMRITHRPGSIGRSKPNLAG